MDRKTNIIDSVVDLTNLSRKEAGAKMDLCRCPSGIRFILPVDEEEIRRQNARAEEKARNVGMG